VKGQDLAQESQLGYFCATWVVAYYRVYNTSIELTLNYISHTHSSFHVHTDSSLSALLFCLLLLSSSSLFPLCICSRNIIATICIIPRHPPPLPRATDRSRGKNSFCLQRIPQKGIAVGTHERFFLIKQLSISVLDAGSVIEVEQLRKLPLDRPHMFEEDRPFVPAFGFDEDLN
jgi:hypothetical protein